MRARFEMLLYNSNLILIKDEAVKYETMSVTNDAENVVEFLLKKGRLKDKRLFYIDTDGRVDELLHDDTRFTGFKLGYKNVAEFNKHFEI